MTISSPEREVKKVKIAVDRNPVETSFERWACDLKNRFNKIV
jgi:photosystem I P700 chlorophyll a apoprotein A1